MKLLFVIYSLCFLFPVVPSARALPGRDAGKREPARCRLFAHRARTERVQLARRSMRFACEAERAFCGCDRPTPSMRRSPDRSRRRQGDGRAWQGRKLGVKIGKSNGAVLAKTGDDTIFAFKQGIVYLIAARVHHRAQNAVKSDEVFRQRLQRGDTDAGDAGAEGQALDGRHTDANAGEEPGPYEQANSSISVGQSSNCASVCSTIGSSVWLCVLPFSMVDSDSIFSSSHKATVAAMAVLSRARMYINEAPYSSPEWRVTVILRRSGVSRSHFSMVRRK